MANDRITMIKLKRMLQLLDAGKSMNEICRELSMSKRTVHSYKQRVVATGVPLQSLRKLDDAQLNAILQPCPNRMKGKENWRKTWKTTSANGRSRM